MQQWLVLILDTRAFLSPCVNVLREMFVVALKENHLTGRHGQADGFEDNVTCSRGGSGSVWIETDGDDDASDPSGDSDDSCNGRSAVQRMAHTVCISGQGSIQ